MATSRRDNPTDRLTQTQKPLPCAHQFHSAIYQDAAILQQCWLPFIGDGALFVPSHPVRPWLSQELPSQVLLVCLPNSKHYCLHARIAMILPAGTGPMGRGGYLMLLQQVPDRFHQAIAEILASVKAGAACDKEHNRQPFTNLPEWLLCCADNDSVFKLQ
jgi:Tfp pilus assembly protein PilZ